MPHTQIICSQPQEQFRLSFSTTLTSHTRGSSKAHQKNFKLQFLQGLPHTSENLLKQYFFLQFQFLQDLPHTPEDPLKHRIFFKFQFLPDLPHTRTTAPDPTEVSARSTPRVCLTPGPQPQTQRSFQHISPQGIPHTRNSPGGAQREREKEEKRGKGRGRKGKEGGGKGEGKRKRKGKRRKRSTRKVFQKIFKIQRALPVLSFV